MATFTPPTLQQLNTLGRTVGRAVPYYSAAPWDGVSPMALSWLGDTDGPFSFERNEQVDALRAEVTGPARLRELVRGEDPLLTLPAFWWAQPGIKDVLTPTDTASGGYVFPREPVYRTLVLFPHRFFFDPEDGVFGVADSNGGDWTVNDKPLTPEQQRLLDTGTIWCWKVRVGKPGYEFTIENAEEAKGEVQVQLLHAYDNPALPDGHFLYTVGDPFEYDIDVEIVTS